MDSNAFFENYERVFMNGEPDRTREFLQRELARAEGDRSAQVTILNELAGFCRNAGDYAGATAAAERAMALIGEMGLEHTVAFGTTLLNAATAYRALGDNARAMELFSKALLLYAPQLPEDDPKLAGLFNNIGAIYEEGGQYAEALAMLEKAVAILERSPALRGDAAIVKGNLAQILCKMGRAAEARVLLRDVLEDFTDRAAGKGKAPDPQRAAVLAGLAEAHYRMGQYAEAVLAYESALGHLKDAFGENEGYAVLCSNCAVACEAAGDKEKAGEYMARSQRALAALGLE